MTTLADRARLGERTFLRRFRSATGLTPTEYLQQRRVEKAREALEFSMQTVSEIAWMVGYQDEGSFEESLGSLWDTIGSALVYPKVHNNIKRRSPSDYTDDPCEPHADRVD